MEAPIMPSPFPGVDPYIEDQAFWRDFHARFLIYCSDQLADLLPDEYVAQVEERFYLVQAADEAGRQYLPDVTVTREGSFPARPAARAGLLSLEPVQVPHLAVATEEVRERWLEIRRHSDRAVISAIEVLSPTNKGAAGQGKYLEKRLNFLEQAIHLVEIDLLIGGRRLPMARPLPAGDYYTMVTRAELRPDCDVYAWTLRDPLPTIPIPLKAPDPDVLLDLASAAATAYDRARYARLLDYAAPLSLPLAPEDRAWAEGLAKGTAPPR